MSDLFRIETPRLVLVWSRAREADPEVLAPSSRPPPGRLEVRAHRREASVWRAEGEDPEGPRLFEETAYTVYLRAKGEARIGLEHRDPVILRGLRASEGGRVVHGRVHFGGQVGRSEFRVIVDGEPELDFTVEVFPTKLDYAEDYTRLREETAEILTALVLEHLRATFHPALPRPAPGETRLEWLALLRHAADALERGLREVARQPRWGLLPAQAPERAERVRRPDAAVRRAALRTGVRERLPEARPRPTLDTPEHRWLAAEVEAARRRLAALRREEEAWAPGPRQARTRDEIARLEARLSALRDTEPLAAAAGAPPPPGLASPQLTRAPGYREAHRSLLLLRRGLHLDGGPVRLALRELGLLYEYWCYLTLARVLAAETGSPLPAGGLLGVEERGLRVLLRRGREHALAFRAADGTRAVLTYNPGFGGDPLLVPQRPDFLLEVHAPGRPTVRAVLDAKYRIDASAAYRARYGAPGPPEEALNVLHRYRDAIVRPGRAGPERLVTRAVALFPYREEAPGAFGESRLRRSLETLGVGALPILPGSTGYLEDWVRRMLEGR